MLKDVLEVIELKSPVEEESIAELGVDSSSADVGEANVAVVLPELHPEDVEMDEEERLRPAWLDADSERLEAVS